MASWLKRTQAGTSSAPITSVPGSALSPDATNAGRCRDPNAPDSRLDWAESRCIYERRLPGNAYITAHVQRLQNGFYDSPCTHGTEIDNVRFLSVKFVFHPSETVHRFQGATVTIALHDDTDQTFTDPGPKAHRMSSYGMPVPTLKPKFLRFAPHVLFGGVSPETLDWNFNLTGSLGVAQGPATASLSPSGGMKGSYKLYQMMKIQGSTRTCQGSRFQGRDYDMEDGELVWTMEENQLQKSGLPREMTFVMLITKGDVENVVFDIDIEPKIASRFGHYPKFWTNMLRYQPLQKEHMDLDRDLGQRFEPSVAGRGFNFANLMASFNDFVSLPGTTYSVTDHAFANQIAVPDSKNPKDEKAALTAVSKKLAPGQKPATRQNISKAIGQGSQPQMGLQPPARAQSVPPQQPIQQSISPYPDEPMDYHIYLHNPRSINLHATPPPKSSSAPPGLQPSTYNLFNPLNASDPIPRPRTIALPERERTKSPSANTKSKLQRRSIDIANMGVGDILSSSRSRSGVRNTSGSSEVSHGSLRRSRSRTDLRNSPLVEDTHSDISQTSSTLRSPKEKTPPCIPSPEVPDPTAYAPQVIPQPPPSPSSSSTDDREDIIPMTAPSPPTSTNMLSPPLPSWKPPSHGHTRTQSNFERNAQRPAPLTPTSPTNAQSTTPSKLPFELNKPLAIRPTINRHNSSGSGSRSRSRPARPRDSPSPFRTRREVTPSPGDEPDDPIINMNTNGTPSSPHEPAAYAYTRSPEQTSRKITGLGLNPEVAPVKQSRTREVSPYAAIANGIEQERLELEREEKWDESKGDLKVLRARKRYSLPAQYSYITSDVGEADEDWEER